MWLQALGCTRYEKPKLQREAELVWGPQKCRCNDSLHFKQKLQLTEFSYLLLPLLPPLHFFFFILFFLGAPLFHSFSQLLLHSLTEEWLMALWRLQTPPVLLFRVLPSHCVSLWVSIHCLITTNQFIQLHIKLSSISPPLYSIDFTSCKLFFFLII